MRALRVVGLEEDGKTVILEDPTRGERFQLPLDERLRAATRGDITRLGQIEIELESQMRPREIQSRIRAGESVEQVAAAAGIPASRVERFAYPVLLERSRTAELAQRAHPIRDDGPDVQTLGEVVAHGFGLRGQDYSVATWDSWKGEDGKWVVQLGWTAGRSDNRAHWAFHPGAHGGTCTPLDDNARDLLDPSVTRALRTVRPVTELAAQALAVEPQRRTVIQHSQPAAQPVPHAVAQPVAPAVNGDPPPREVREPEPASETDFVQDFELTQGPVTRSQARPQPRVEHPPEPDLDVELAEPAPQQPVRPAAHQPVAEQPVAEQPVAEQPVAEQPVEDVVEPMVNEPAITEQQVEQRASEHPVTRQPATEEPTTGQPVTDQRAAEQAAPEQPVDEPADTEAPANSGAPADTAGPAEPAAEPPAASTAPATPTPAAPAGTPAPGRARKSKKARPIVPSWEDVLLGTRSNRG